jgi:uncharacterized membrane protein YphA (DoxX/SURF4 family)
MVHNSGRAIGGFAVILGAFVAIVSVPMAAVLLVALF